MRKHNRMQEKYVGIYKTLHAKTYNACKDIYTGSHPTNTI